nr:unnamed protein product [Digitaria exilis]
MRCRSCSNAASPTPPLSTPLRMAYAVADAASYRHRRRCPRRRATIAVAQVEQDVETVIHVLQPGPIGIVEHKFTDVEILEARTTVKRAVDNWQRNWVLERNLEWKK